MLTRLFKAFENRMDSLAMCREMIRDANVWQRKYPSLYRKLERFYDSTIRDAAYFYRAVKKAILHLRLKSNPPPPSLEVLERMFIRWRDETKLTEKQARTFYIGKQFDKAKKASARAKALRVLTSDAAHALSAHMRAKGLWSEAMVKELGLKRWL
jgi:hypothetical protein